MNNCKPISFSSNDGYIYNGLLFEAEQSKTTVIHVHGSCGNARSFHSINDLAQTYQHNGINLLAFDLKGHDCIAEGNWNTGKFEYIGGSIVNFNECINDIRSAISFCNNFSERIILQGHSMGCERVLTYQIETKNFYDTILISPCNAYELQSRFIYPESVLEQINRIKRMDKNILLENEYGIKNKNENYLIPIYKDAYLSIANGHAFKLFNVNNPEQFFIPKNCLCCIGCKDNLQTNSPEEMFNLIRSNFISFTSSIFNCNHEFNNCGLELGEKIVSWIKNIDKI